MIGDDIRSISERANRELDAVHDFFEHSKVVWEAFQVFVDGGHKTSSINVATGTVIDQDGLLKLAPHYTTQYLVSLTFRQFVASFEVFLFAFLHRVVLHNPWQFARSQLDFEVVLRAADREEILASVLLKQLNDLKYESVRGWFAVVNKAISLGCPSADEIDLLAEIKAARDILEHNSGVVNETYLRKASSKARHEIGDYIYLDSTYYLESWRLLKKIVSDLSAQCIARIASPPP